MKALGYQNLRCHTPAKQFGGPTNSVANGSILSLHALGESIFAIYSDLTLCSYKLYHTRASIPFQFKIDKARELESRNTCLLHSTVGRDVRVTDIGNDLSAKLETLRGQGSLIGNWSFAMTSGGNSTVTDGGSSDLSYLLLSCGYLDDCVKVHSLDSLQLRSIQNGGHRGRINCLQVGEDGAVMVTGGQDATCRIWMVDHDALAAAITDGFVQTSLGMDAAERLQDSLLKCCHVLLGHITPITCLAISSKLDVIVSGSQDGSICIHNIRSGRFIRSLHVDASTKKVKESCSRNGIPVRKLAIHMDGSFVAHLCDGSLHVITINGQWLCSTHVGESLHTMIICSHSETLITGGEQGCARIWKLHDLSLQCTVDVEKYGAITSLALTPPEASPATQFLCVGSSNGLLSIVFRNLEGK